MAEIAHAYVEQLTQQTTTSGSFVDVTGVSIGSGSFVAGQKYLIYVSGYTQHAASGDEGQVQMVHGSTAFTDSRVRHNQQTGTANQVRQYCWFTVWTAVAAEGVKMQFLANAGTMKVNQVTFYTMRLDADLVENTDWFYNEVSASTTLSTTDSTTNNATVTFTPVASHDWLVLTGSSESTTSISNGMRSRQVSAGTFNDTNPFVSSVIDATTEILFLSLIRAYPALGASAQTFTEKSSESAGTTCTRSFSNIFVLDLNKFAAHSVTYTQAVIALGTTSYGTNVATISFDPTGTTDCVVIGATTFDGNAGGRTNRQRVQVDGVSAPNSTDQNLDNVNNNGSDEDAHYLMFMDSMASGSKTINLDGSTNDTTNTPGSKNRQIAAFTTLLPGGAPPPTVKALADLGVG